MTPTERLYGWDCRAVSFVAASLISNNASLRLRVSEVSLVWFVSFWLPSGEDGRKWVRNTRPEWMKDDRSMTPQLWWELKSFFHTTLWIGDKPMNYWNCHKGKNMQWRKATIYLLLSGELWDITVWQFPGKEVKRGTLRSDYGDMTSDSGLPCSQGQTCSIWPAGSHRSWNTSWNYY